MYIEFWVPKAPEIFRNLHKIESEITEFYDFLWFAPFFYDFLWKWQISSNFMIFYEILWTGRPASFYLVRLVRKGRTCLDRPRKAWFTVLGHNSSSSWNFDMRSVALESWDDFASHKFCQIWASLSLNMSKIDLKLKIRFTLGCDIWNFLFLEGSSAPQGRNFKMRSNGLNPHYKNRNLEGSFDMIA